MQAGELGRVLQVHARRVGPFPERVRDVGVVLDLAPHDIDVMRFITGSEVARVQAETEQRINTEHEDMLSGLLRFANGVDGRARHQLADADEDPRAVGARRSAACSSSTSWRAS